MNIAIITQGCNIQHISRYLHKQYQRDDYPNSGVPSVTNITEGIILAGHKVDLYVLYDCKEVARLTGDMLTIVLVPKGRKNLITTLFSSFFSAKNIRTAITPYIDKYDCINAHWHYHTILAVIPWRKSKKIFCTIRDWTSLIFRNLSLKNKILWLHKYVISEYIMRCRNIKFVANSPYTMELLKNRLHQNDIPTIPNPVNDNFFVADRSEYPQSPIITSVLSSFDKRKNCETLLRAFKLVRNIAPTAKLILIGSRYYVGSPDLQPFADMGLLEGVDLKGQLSHTQIKDIFLESTMLVHPAIEETFGNTLIEAMACKLPIVGGKDSGAVPYVLNYGECGHLCNVLSSNELCDCIIDLFDSGKAKDMGEKGYNRALSEFSQKAVANQYIELYKSIT